MNLTKAVDRYIQSCRQYSDSGDLLDLALVLSELLESEEENLISRTWRGKLDVEKYLSLASENRQVVQKSWERSYKQLKPILDYGGYMEYEEMGLILSLRSDLTSLGRFLSDEFLEQYKRPLELIDEDLVSVLKLNKEYTRDARNSSRRYTGGLETYLPKHWWWRYDEEN